MPDNYDSKDLRKGYMQAEADTTWVGWRLFWKVVVLLIVFGAVGFGLKVLFTPAAMIQKALNPDSIISNYEDFQSMYNTCAKIDSDLKTIRSTPDDDAMFAQFSKGAMVAAKRQLMTRWVNEYNAKSKMINRNLWKAKALPYQLNEEDYPNYNGGMK